jgi:hypothetical protein
MRTVFYKKVSNPFKGINNASNRDYAWQAEGKIFESLRELRETAHQVFGGLMNDDVRLVRVDRAENINGTLLDAACLEKIEKNPILHCPVCNTEGTEDELREHFCRCSEGYAFPN